MFMQAKTKLDSLLKTEVSARNMEFYPNDMLESMMKICINNSLVPLKALMMKGKCRIDIGCKNPSVPTLEVTPLTK